MGGIACFVITEGATMFDPCEGFHYGLLPIRLFFFGCYLFGLSHHCQYSSLLFPVWASYSSLYWILRRRVGGWILLNLGIALCRIIQCLRSHLSKYFLNHILFFSPDYHSVYFIYEFFSENLRCLLFHSFVSRFFSLSSVSFSLYFIILFVRLFFSFDIFLHLEA